MSSWIYTKSVRLLEAVRACNACVRLFACACVLRSELRAGEWECVCNHVRQAVMNGVFETERSVEFLRLDQIGNRKTNIA